MAKPKPITIEYIDPSNYEGYTPQPFAIVGDAPAEVTPQVAPAVDPAPADADAVAADLQSVVDALIAAGVFTEP